MSQRYGTPDGRKERKGVEENEDDDQTSCLEKICCCMKPSRKKDGKLYDRRNGDTEKNGTNRNGGICVDHPSLKTSNGEETERQDQKSSRSLKEEKLGLVMETVSRPDAGQGLFQEQQNMLDRQDSSYGSLGDGKLNPPETNVSSTEADLSRKQQKGLSPMKVGTSEAGHSLPKEQQNEYIPRKHASSSEAGPWLSKEQQKIYSPKKTLGSPEVSHLLLNEPKKPNPPAKTVSSSEAGGKLLLEEQKKIEPGRKIASSTTQAHEQVARKTSIIPQERQLPSTEKQKGLIKEDTSYGSIIDEQFDSPIETSNTPKQGGHIWLKEQDKDVIQKGINRLRNYAESTPSKITNRGSGNQLEEQQKRQQ